MQSLSTALRRLEHLKTLVDEIAPIRYESTERTRELHQQIPSAYGAIEEVYKKYAGEHDVIIDKGSRASHFTNYFEAGWLSGRTFHATEGYNELIKVIGRVRADVEDSGEPESEVDPIECAWKLLHPKVQVIAASRFNSGNYADAVEATFKELASNIRTLVQQRGGPELDGVALMQTAFSAKDPLIVLADLSNQSGRDMQRGYMDLYAGAMSAVRNPKAHGNVVITAERAIHLLFLASTLWYTLDERP
jgi:uncharacterized protein (TIGR02391 family)